jgi:hypothetical protein
MATWIALIFLSVSISGCALLSTAISAGVAYGLYQATKK